MIGLVSRKVIRNPGLTLTLAAGVLVAVTMASGIPLYTEGVLEALLHRSLDERESSGEASPGAIIGRATFWRHGGEGESVESLGATHENVVRLMDYGLPVRYRSRLVSTGPFFVRTAGGESAARAGTMLTLEILEGFAERIERRGPAADAPAPGPAPGPPGSADSPLPVLLAEEAASALDLRAGERYLLVGAQSPLARDLWVRIGGTFLPRDPRDPFWEGRYVPTQPSLYVDAADFEDAAAAEYGFPRVEVEWLCAVDHSGLAVRELGARLRRIESRARALAELGVSVSVPLQGILEDFRRRERSIRLSLLFLQVPVWLLIAFFIADAAILLVRHDRAEIAVLMSRGASGRQVLSLYAVIAAAIAAFGLAAGPPLGLLAGRVLGSASGFLSFVRRSPLPVALGTASYGIAAVAAVAFAAVMLPPAASASRVGIVQSRRSGSRPGRGPIWKRLFLDVLLLAVSAYGLYGGTVRGRIVGITGASVGDLPLDPLLFVASVMFLLGSSLLFVRLFPLAVELLRRAGTGRRSAVVHAALLHLAREPAGRDSTMILLVFTVAVGIYGASTARTMNRHFEDAVRQRIGADLTMLPLWVEAVKESPSAAGQAAPGEEAPSASSFVPSPGRQFASAAAVERAVAAAAGQRGVEGRRAAVRPEETLDVCRGLPGVERATWVLRAESASVADGRSGDAASALMAVTPSEFGRVAWSRRDLYPAGFARLLNALASRQDGLLVSRSLADERSLKQGDRLSLSWGERSSARGVVLGVFDYWPGHDSRAAAGGAHLVVANLPYLEAMTSIGPREVWLRRDRAVDRQSFYAALRDAGVTLTGLQDAEREVARSREGPYVRGINGVLTLAFLASVAVCVAGLAMHTIVSLRGRTLELGVERAAGLSRAEVTAMLALEQSLLLVASIAAGTALGGVGGQFFIPLLQTATGAAERIVPFVVGAAPEDYRNVIVFAAVVLASSLGVLGAFVRRLRVAETLKLGEQ